MRAANSLHNTAANEMYTSTWEDNNSSWSFCELLTSSFVINYPGSITKFGNLLVL